MPAYLGQFESRLLQYVVGSVSSYHLGLDPAMDAETERMRQCTSKLHVLYGEVVLPVDLTALYNRGLCAPEFVCEPGTDIKGVRSVFYALLHRMVLKIEEHPVVTRFFTFSECCWCLLRMK